MHATADLDPESATACAIAWAHLSARAGPSDVAKSPSPVEPTYRPPIKIPTRQPDQGYVAATAHIYTYVPDHAQAILTDERNA